MSSAVIAAFALLFVAAVSASPCTNFVAKANLDSARINGQWFGVYGNVHGAEMPSVKCVKENIQTNADGQITAQFEYIKTANNEKVMRSGTGAPIAGVRSRLSVTYPDSPNAPEDVVILGSDYDHYTVWASCAPATPQAYNVAVMSKHTTLSAALLEEVKQTLRENNIPDTLAQLPATDC